MAVPAPPPEESKPWYYQDWFLFPTAVFWPLWAVLILRSPWHNGLVSGALAWAMLIVGSYFIFWAQLLRTGGLNQLTIALVLPGMLLTVITQVHWQRYRTRLREAAGQAVPLPPTQAPVEDGAGVRRRRRARRHRRGRR